MFDYLREALKQAKEMKMNDKRKKALLNKNMDYAFLEHIIQEMNENPELQVKITLSDGTVLDCNTRPKRKAIPIIEPEEQFMEVK